MSFASKARRVKVPMLRARLRSRRRYSRAEFGLFQNFLAHHLSAAGVSYVVTSRSRLRRFTWLLAVLLTFGGMSYMTYQVVQEYLTYPTVMDTKNIRKKVLEFPAVTICGLNLIPKFNSREANLEYIEKMTDELNELEKYSPPFEEIRQCAINPMCYRMWFHNTCKCVLSPCDTEMCFPRKDGMCICSMKFCMWNNTEIQDACHLEDDPDEESKSCICDSEFRYSRATPRRIFEPEMDVFRGERDKSDSGCGVPPPPRENRPPGPPPDPNDGRKCEKGPRRNLNRPPGVEEDLNFTEALKTFKKKRIRELMEQIKYSITDDLKDIERQYMPSLKDTQNYGIPLDSLILSCSYGRAPCDERNFTTIFSPSFGRCYVFNFIGHSEDGEEIVPAIETKHAGKDNGLHLYLQSNKQDSISLLTKKLGVRVVIHAPESVPYASENGLDIRPGDMAGIDVQYTEIYRLGKPWGECLNDGSSLPFKYNDIPYSQLGCERKCMNWHVYRRCRCYHRMFLTGTTQPDIKMKLCDSTQGSKDDLCFFSILTDREEGKTNCSCPPPCKEKRYLTTTSTAQVNPNFFWVIKTVRSLIMKDEKPAVANISKDIDVIGLNVYYSDLIITNITEKATYSWESLIANIGGNMGLFLGLSLITFLELLEFLFDAIFKIFERKPKRIVRKTIKVQDLIKY